MVVKQTALGIPEQSKTFVLSVGSRRLCRVDDEDVNRSLGGLKLKAELLLYGGK
jgi:hypothetical protein